MNISDLQPGSFNVVGQPDGNSQPTASPQNINDLAPGTFSVAPLQQVSAPAQPSAPQPGIFSRIGHALTSPTSKLNSFSQNNPVNTGVNNATGAAADNLTETLNHQQSAPAGALGAFSDLADPLVHLAAKPFQPISSAFNKITGGIENAVGTTQMNQQGDQQIAQAKNDFTTAHPDASKEIGGLASAFNVAGTIAGGEEALKVAPGAASDIKGALEGNDSIAGRGLSKVQDLGSNLRQSAVDNLSKKYATQSQEELSKPATTTGKYKNATAIFNKAKAGGTDLGQVLVNNKITHSDIVEDGKYNTAEISQKLRDDAGEVSADSLRPALQKADLYTPKTPIQDIIDNAITNIKSSKETTPGDIETQIAQARSEGASLARKYPNGMSLEDMHDNKITYSKNAGYSPVKDPAVNNIASKNRAISSALGDMVEQKAPSEIPVGNVNAELQKQYQAADYLKALDGQKAPVSAVARVAKIVAKGAGAAVGGGIGGGILGEVAGYHVGGYLEGLMENMSNPVKASFLKNLETSNPEAFTKLEEYMKSPAPNVQTQSAADLTRTPVNSGDKMVKVNNYQSPDYSKYIPTTSDPVKAAGKITENALGNKYPGFIKDTELTKSAKNQAVRNIIKKAAVDSKTPTLDSLNPTGKLFTDYTPESRASMKLGDNITTLDKTSGESPSKLVTVFRGTASNQKGIVPGDFITTNEQLAKDYAGSGKIVSKKVPLSHILDDKTEPLGEEYIYRPSSNKK